MSGRRHLPPGPWDKTAAWRGGAFMLGAAALALAVDWISGDLIEVGFGRLIVVLCVAGLTLSAPFGLGWLRGEHDRRARTRAPARQPYERIDGPAGSTYVIVNGGSVSTAGGPATRAVRARELGPGWYVAYTLVWRWPVIAGDALLSGLWSLAGQFSTLSPLRNGQGYSAEDAEPQTAEDRGSPERNF
ncbi:MAG: hypothetical protein RJQ03_06160 [Miltoncostaeaceae bacterium]